MVDVAVIILTRNTCALTRAAIQSVLDSRDSLAKEIFVVDNGSIDETPSVLPREFPDLKLIRPEKNLGFARACNLAAKHSSGEFLLLLNSDARLAPDALARAAAWMRANPGCAVAGAQLLNADGSRQNSIANFPTLATELLSKSLLRRLWPEKFPGKERECCGPMDVETIVGAFMFVRKPVWDCLGGLDERFFFFFEETDFCLQARRKKFRVVHLPEVRVRHDQGQTAKQISTGARIEYWRSRYAYFAKNHHAATRLVLIIGLMVRLFFDWFAAGLLVLSTLGQNTRWRSRWCVCSALLGWHLCGCPAKAGLPQ
ncbi:MAG TPA: glycosyltransferase family 2 protein [Candidatus Paceibacterota bacterium]|nr:glycosyltransferase family 2 protein [Candidatus Paceibacterota bacterium]